MLYWLRQFYQNLSARRILKVSAMYSSVYHLLVHNSTGPYLAASGVLKFRTKTNDPSTFPRFHLANFFSQEEQSFDKVLGRDFNLTTNNPLHTWKISSYVLFLNWIHRSVSNLMELTGIHTMKHGDIQVQYHLIEIYCPILSISFSYLSTICNRMPFSAHSVIKYESTLHESDTNVVESL